MAFLILLPLGIVEKAISLRCFKTLISPASLRFNTYNNIISEYVVLLPLPKVLASYFLGIHKSSIFINWDLMSSDFYQLKVLKKKHSH